MLKGHKLQSENIPNEFERLSDSPSRRRSSQGFREAYQGDSCHALVGKLPLLGTCYLPVPSGYRRCWPQHYCWKLMHKTHQYSTMWIWLILKTPRDHGDPALPQSLRYHSQHCWTAELTPLCQIRDLRHKRINSVKWSHTLAGGISHEKMEPKMYLAGRKCL